MVDKLELPQANITRLIKDGAADSVDNGVMVPKDTKKAFQQVSGLYVLYLSSM
jgi:histone H3/H4